MDMLNVKYLLVQQNNEQNIIKNPNVWASLGRSIRFLFQLMPMVFLSL